jgi:2-aminoadipate transaminase
MGCGTGEVISFADAGMAAELVPWEALRAAKVRVKSRFEGEGNGAYREDAVTGLCEDIEKRFASLHGTITERMRKRGMASARAEQVVLTKGLEHALEWVVRALTEPGDTILVECPTGSAVLSVLARCGLQVVAIECDEQGVRVEALERLLEGAAVKPKLLYAAPTYGDPRGRVWSLERRQDVLALCQAYGVSIVEDDSCGELKFHSDALDVPTLIALAGEAGGVLYVNSFESIVAPSLQVGWIACCDEVLLKEIGVGARGDAINLMHRSVEAGTAGGSVFDQLVLTELLRGFDLDARVRRLTHDYRERMYAMQRQLRIHQAAGLQWSWSEPEGGKFLWLTLPDGLDGEALRRLTLLMGVDISPGSRFYAGERQLNTVRLSFTSCSLGQIEQGIAIIAEAIKDFTGRWSDV